MVLSIGWNATRKISSRRLTTKPWTSYWIIFPTSLFKALLNPNVSQERERSKIIRKAEKVSPEQQAEWSAEYGEALAAALEQFFDVEDEDPDGAKLRDGFNGFSSGIGTVVQVEIGQREFAVADSYDTAEELAIEMVAQDLEHEPELFTQSWLENFINVDRIRRDLYSDEFDSLYNDLTDHADRDPEDVAERMGLDPSDYEVEDEDGDVAVDEDLLRKAIDENLDDFVQREVEERLRDPVGYLVDMFGQEGMKRALKFGGIDIDEAAKDAVRTDGAGHFLGHYDGELRDLPDSGVYWRLN